MIFREVYFLNYLIKALSNISNNNKDSKYNKLYKVKCISNFSEI